MSEFAKALREGDLVQIRRVPKADLHSHLLLGMRRDRLAAIAGREIHPFYYSGRGIEDINRWIRKEYFALLRDPGLFPLLVKASFQQAVEDGITLLEASIDVGFGHLNGIAPEEVVNLLEQA
ncbi:MAG: hypothetical protein JXA23_10945, partial [Bacteroidales bacterium]|nr:hypothetical protein [Bacteroidales bacterium]